MRRGRVIARLVAEGANPPSLSGRPRLSNCTPFRSGRSTLLHPADHLIIHALGVVVGTIHPRTILGVRRRRYQTDTDKNIVGSISAVAKRILIVDDEQVVRSVFRRMLETAGYAAEEAEDGHVAIAQFQNAPYDLVVLDLIMPGMEGFETMRALRRMAPNLPVVVVTGGGRFGQAHTYLECPVSQRC
jgi:CheY-like chemotaxis protein